MNGTDSTSSQGNPRRGSTTDSDHQVCLVQNCGRKIAEKDFVVRCRRCLRGAHHKCVGMDDVTFKAYTKAEAFSNYHCGGCLNDLKNLEERVRVLESRAAGGGGGDVFTAELIGEVVQKVIKELLPKITDIMNGAIEELIERQQKGNSLVMVGLPEGESMAADLDTVNGICDKIGVDKGAVERIFRHGQINEVASQDASAGTRRSRIMKIKFKDLAARRKFLFEFRGIRNTIPGCENAFVRNDLTFKQRQQDYALREEVKRRRANGEACKIAKGRVVSLN